jgi:hypothetical protein
LRRELAQKLGIVFQIGCVSLCLGGGCADVASDRPARTVSIDPAFLDFGSVSISGQRSLSLSLTVQGDEFDITNASTSSGKFRFLIPEEFRRGLADGETGSMQIQYRPCPQAWEDDKIISGFDFSACALRADEGRLRIVDSRYGWAAEIALLGRPAEPGRLEVACTRTHENGQSAHAPLFAPCDRIDFGMVSNGGTAETSIEIRNTAKMGSAPIHIRALDLKLAGPEKGEVFDGKALGIDGLPGERFALEAGASRKLRLVFSPRINGQWRGDAEAGLGLSVFTDSSGEDAAKQISVLAMSSAPRLEVYPAVLSVPRKSPGSHEIMLVTLSNSGNEILQVSELQTSGNFPLSILDSGPFFLAPGGSQEVQVVYSGSEQAFQSSLLIMSNDPHQSQMTVEVQIQPVPKLCIEPVPLLEITDEVGNLRFSNCGDGVLEIRELELVRSEASTSYNSLDDFLVEGCSGGHCQPNIRLCAAHDSTCAISSTVFHVVYENGDNSPFDLAALIVRSNDPEQSELTIILKGIDNAGGG